MAATALVCSGAVAMSTPANAASAPGAPTLSATAGYLHVALAWTVPTNDGGSPITGYNVYRGLASGQEDSTPINGSTPVTGTTYDDTGLLNGTTYYYEITAVNASGPSPNSNEVSATPAPPSSGTAYAWGDNSYGELGNGTSDPSNPSTSDWKPQAVDGANQVGTLDRVVRVAGGSNFSTAVDNNGTAWAWGDNQPINNISTTPVDVGLAGVTDTAGGTLNDFTLAVDSNHDVWGWGDNSCGQLGQDPKVNYSVNSPAKITSLSNVVAVAAGDCFTLALDTSGHVWALGDNSVGELGNGADLANTYELPNPTPTEVIDPTSPGQPLSNVTAISAGGQSGMALLGNGTVLDWGAQNQLGDGQDAADSSTPVQVTGLSGATAIAAGEWDDFAVAGSMRNVWGWGTEDTEGALGDGNPTSHTATAPVQVSGLSGVTGIAAGDRHAQALKNDGTLWAWGLNSSGEIGDGTTNDRPTPVPVSTPAGAPIVGIGAGSSHSLAIIGSNSATPTVPDAPANPKATGGDAQVSLSWAPPSYDGGSAVTSYKIYRGTTAGAETFLAQPSGTGTTYTDATAANGTTYYYTISAVNSLGESPMSNEVSATPQSGSTASAPGAPTNLTATGGDSQVTLSWTAPANNGGSTITGYEIYRGTASGAETLLASSGTATTYTDSGLTNGTTYYYKVAAVNSIGTGPQSNEAVATAGSSYAAYDFGSPIIASTTQADTSPVAGSTPFLADGTELWSAFAGSDCTLHVTHSTDGGATWLDDVTVAGATGQVCQGYPTLARDGSSTVVAWAALNDPASPINTIYFSSRPDTASQYSSPVAVASAEGISYSAMSVDGSGSIWLVYLDSSGTEHVVVSSDNGQSWMPTGTLTPPNCSSPGSPGCVSMPAMTSIPTGANAAVPGGEIIVAADGDIWTSTDSGSTWTLRTTGLSGPNYIENSVAVGKTGTIYLAADPDNSVLDVATSTDGGTTWNTPTAVSPFVASYGFGLVANVDPTASTDAYLTWSVDGNQGHAGFVYTSDHGATWSPVQTLGFGGINPRVAAGPGTEAFIGGSDPFSSYSYRVACGDIGHVCPYGATTTAPVITSASSATFTEGSAGSFLVTTTGSPTPVLSVSGSLPSGVTFTDNGDGTATLAGTPANGTAGSYPLTVTATNSGGSAQQSFTLTVNAPAASAPDAPLLQSVRAGDGSASVTWSPAATGATPQSYTITAHPHGASDTTGDKSTTVTAPATSGTLSGLVNLTAYDLSVTANDAAGSSLPTRAWEMLPQHDAYWSTVTGPDSAGTAATAQIYRYDLSADTVTNVAAGYQPRLSPDGRWLAFENGGALDSHGPTYTAPVYLLDLTDPSATPVELLTSGDWIVGYSFTGDSQSLVYDYSCGIYRTAVTTGGAVSAGSGATLYSNSCYNDNPIVGPDGTSLLFDNSQSGGGLLLGDSAGSTATLVPGTAPGDYASAWSPDGKTLAYWTSSNGTTALQVIPASGGQASTLASASTPDGLNTASAWSADGGSVLAGGSLSGTPGAYVIATDGSQASALLPGSTGSAAPAYVGAVVGALTAPVQSPPPSGGGGVAVPSAPGAPGTPVVTFLDPSTVGLAWPAPSSDGGSPINGYTVAVSPACGSCTGLTVSASNGSVPTQTTISGLTPGTTYVATVTATNAAGTGPSSGSVSFTTPAPGTISPTCDGQTSAPFTDDGADPLAPDIACAYHYALTYGTTASTFSPRSPVTREEVASFLARLITAEAGALPSAPANPFTDVPSGDVHRLAIDQLAAVGIVQGVTATQYDPLGQVSRAELAALLTRTWSYLTGMSLPTPEGMPFADVDPQSPFAQAIAEIAGSDITLGRTATTYAPDDPVLRDEMTAFLDRVLALLADNGHPPTS